MNKSRRSGRGNFKGLIRQSILLSSSIKKKIKGGSARRLADFLKVLRFSFPVPVVGASAFTFAVENIKKSPALAWRY